MVRKEHLRNNCVNGFFIFWCWFILFSCNETVQKKPNFFEPLDLAKVHNDTVDRNQIQLRNGIAYHGNKTFSGYVLLRYPNRRISSISSYLDGQLYGLSKTYYPDGIPKDVRSYRNNLCYGRHYGYWENGKQKFDYFYIDEKREGWQKQWYQTGKPARFLHYRDDKEEGMQHAWRENGKLYINYEVRDGIRYGLQKSALCYKVKSKKK